jgi:hypothetical protein
MQANSTYIRWIVVLCAVIFYSCATTVSVNSKRISQNHKFDGRLTIYRIDVDSFYSYGAPAKYSSKIYCKAINLRSVADDDAAAALLKGEKKKEFLSLKAMKDSFERVTVPEYRPADTLDVVNGPRIYIAAGVRHPTEYILVQRRMGEIKESIKIKEQKIIYFNKPNKHYYWMHAGKEVFEKVQRIVFEPGQWYATYMDCKYGFLADGTCKLYFRFDEKGKVEFHKVDDVNDGPF